MHLELHTDLRRDAPATVIAVGLLSTAETDMAGVPEGERVLIKVGDARAIIIVADFTSIETDRIHGPARACFGVITRHACFLFRDPSASRG